MSLYVPVNGYVAGFVPASARGLLCTVVGIVGQFIVGIIGYRAAIALALIHQGVALLQIGVADKAVTIKRRAVHHFVGIEQAFALVDGVRAQYDVAYGYVVDSHDGGERRDISSEPPQRSRAVTQGAGTQEGQHDVRTRAQAPNAQRSAKNVLDTVGAVHGDHVDTPAQAHGGVEHHTAQRIEEIVATGLKQAVEGRPHIFDVAEDVADTGAHRCGREITVRVGNGLEHGAIDGVVEGERAAVQAFERIARAGRFNGGTAGQGKSRNDYAETESRGGKTRVIFHC